MFFIDPPYPDSMGFDRLNIYLPASDITQIPLTARPQTLIALALVLTASFIITIDIANSVVNTITTMARKKRSSAAKAQVDARPETSPYASKTCTLPFASPLSVPHEVLIKSPKLYAAYESNLPELPQISEDVGHVLVHYLHTGKYETLKPKSSEDISKQIVELKTSIQAYAAARAYELTELMRLSEIQIERHGEGLPLPTLLEVARDAHPTLTDNDNWFLDFLRARIRPHLRDAKALRESDLLDRISSILSPNRVLLRTVLELFCENIGRAPTPPPAAAAAAAAPQAAEKQKQQPRQAPQSELPFSSPISSPDISRPGSPLPQANGVPREDSHSSSSSLKKKTPTWSSLDQTTILEEVPRQVVAEPTEVSLPIEEAQSKPVFDLDDIIADDEPEQVHEVVEEIKKDDFKPLALTEDKAVAEPENKTEVTPAPAVEAETEVKLAVEPEIPEPILEPEAEPEVKAAPEVVKKAAPFPIVIPQKQRERADSAKVIDMEPPVEAGEFKALPILEEVPGVPIAIPDSMPAVESSSTKRVAYRQADSGFWDATPSPSLREGPSSIPEFEVAPVTVEPVADIETFGVTESKQDKVVDTKEGKTTEEEVARETATSEAVEAPISSVLSSPTLLPSHFDLPAEILEATALSAAANAEPEPETKENEKEKSVSPPVPTEPSTEEAKTTTESDLPDSAVVETAAVPAATESADTDAISTPAPATKVVDAPNADDTTGPSDAKTSEPEPQQPESQPESEHAELTTIPEQLEPVEATKPSEEQPKPAAPAAVEVVPAVGAVQQQVSKPTPTSSSASLHVGGLRGLRKSRSRRSNRGSTVSLSAANAPQTAEQQAGAQDSPIPVPAPAPAKVSGSGGGWKKKWLRYPVLFGKGM